MNYHTYIPLTAHISTGINSIRYGSAIALCGIIAAFAVHQVFWWLQKRATSRNRNSTISCSLLAQQTPGHCNNRGFRLDLGNVHHRSRDHPRGVRAACFGGIFRCGWSLRSSTSTAGGWHRRPTSTTGSSGCSRSRHALSSGSSPSSWSPSQTQRCRAASSSTTPCRTSSWRSGSRSRPHTAATSRASTSGLQKRGSRSRSRRLDVHMRD